MIQEINKEEVKTTKRESVHSAWIDAVVIILIFVIAQALGGVLALTAGVRMPGEAMTTSFDTEVLEAAASMQARFVAVAYLISMVICYLVLFVYGHMRRWQVASWWRLQGGLAPVKLLMGYLIMWCVSIAVEPLAEILPGDQYSLGSGGWLLFSAVLLAPIFEESVFRGYLASRLRSAYGGMVAWLVSALAFGVIHGIPSVVVTATMSGLVLGFYYLRYRSLGLVIMLHAMNNLTACFLLTLDVGDATTRELLGGGSLYWGVYAVSAVIAVTALVRMGRIVCGIKSDNYIAKE